MPHTPYELMQMAVDIVHSSDHPKNKVAAVLAGTDHDGGCFDVAYTNYWPDIIREKFGKDIRIGDASGTVHAETACILHAPRTDGASIYVTDPFCPNCAKNIAEAGIKTVYIDHKGFDKDFAERRRAHFENMSMRICEKAGISVYELWRKEEKIVPILEVPDDYVPPEDNPVIITPLPASPPGRGDVGVGLEALPYATAYAENAEGDIVQIIATQHASIGYTEEQDSGEIAHPPDDKYSFLLEPVNRLLMAAARHGLVLDKSQIFSSRMPTSREQVNMVGAGIERVFIGNPEEARDEGARVAMAQLSTAGVLEFED